MGNAEVVRAEERVRRHCRAALAILWEERDMRSNAADMTTSSAWAVVAAILLMVVIVVIVLGVAFAVGLRARRRTRRVASRNDADDRRVLPVCAPQVDFYSRVFDYGDGAPVQVRFRRDTRITALLWGGGGGGGGPLSPEGGFPASAGGGGGFVWATFLARKGRTYALVRGMAGLGGRAGTAVPTPPTSATAGGTTSLVDVSEDGNLSIQAFGGAAGVSELTVSASDGGIGGGGTASACVEFAVAQGTQGAPNQSSAGGNGITLGGSASGGGGGAIMQTLLPSSAGGTPGGGGAAGGLSNNTASGTVDGGPGGPGRIILMYSSHCPLQIVERDPDWSA